MAENSFLAPFPTKMGSFVPDAIAAVIVLVLGLVILAVGNYFANLAYRLLGRSNEGAIVANVARYAILALVLAIGLHAMGIADNIVLLAFGLSLGAVAVAVALSFGLGGREAAGKHMECPLGKLCKDGR